MRTTKKTNLAAVFIQQVCLPVRSTAVCAVVLSLLSLSAMSAERVDLYSAERIIAQNANQARQVAVLADALDEVFRRVSGQTMLPDHSALREARRSPQDLLSRSSLAASDVTIPDAIGNPQPTHLVRMTFEPSLVENALTEAGVPIWSSVRPRTLLLLAGPEGDRIELLPESADAEAVSVIKQHARTVGLPVFWPALDLVDVQTISPTDIWQGEQAAFEIKGERYRADSVLGGYVGFDASEQRWVGRWHLYFGGDRTSGTYFGDNLETVLEQGMRMAARVMSNRYAVDFSVSTPSEYDITVLNLTNLSTHGEVRRYLNGLIGVSDLKLLSLEGDEARYRLTSVAERAQLLDLLALEGQLQEVSSIGFGFVSNPELEFIWRD